MPLGMGTRFGLVSQRDGHWVTHIWRMRKIWQTDGGRRGPWNNHDLHMPASTALGYSHFWFSKLNLDPGTSSWIFHFFVSLVTPAPCPVHEVLREKLPMMMRHRAWVGSKLTEEPGRETHVPEIPLTMLSGLKSRPGCWADGPGLEPWLHSLEVWPFIYKLGIITGGCHVLMHATFLAQSLACRHAQ